MVSSQQNIHESQRWQIMSLVQQYYKEFSSQRVTSVTKDPTRNGKGKHFEEKIRCAKGGSTIEVLCNCIHKK